MRCMRFWLSTPAAQAIENLLGPGVSDRDGTAFGSQALGCVARLSGWTRYRADGREIADGPRYRLCGNGVVGTVAEWLAKRIVAASEGFA